MSLNDSICAALADFLRERDVDVREVLSYEEEMKYGGYCETCAYEYMVLEITYKDSNNKTKYYTYDGTFAELIRSL